MAKTRIIKKTALMVLLSFIWLTLGQGWAFTGQEDALAKARELIRDGDYDGAIRLLEDYIAKIRLMAEQQKNIAEAYYIISKIYYTVGESDQVDENLRRVFEIYPNFTTEEPDLSFKEYVDKINEQVLSLRKQKLEEEAPKEGKPIAVEKVGKAKKKKFPIAIIGGAAVLLGVGALVLAKGKGGSSTPAPPQYGNILVKSEPSGAKVYLDGSDTGKATECTLSNVSVGTHQLKLVLESYGKWEGSAEVRQGQTTNVSATLAPFTYEFVSKWGTLGSGDGQLYTPYFIAIDSSDNIYVAEYHNHRVQKFTSSGTFITKWGSRGNGEGQFDYPSGIAIDNSGFVYTTEQSGCRIQKFASGGSFVAKWGSSGTDNGQFRVPVEIAVDKSGMIYVTDYNNNRIQKFTSNGSYLAQWGGFGSADGQLYGPIGIAVDSDDFVYVVDRGNNRIQKFTTNGSFVAKWGNEGTGDGEFKGPEGIGVDNTGFIFVTDGGNRRVQKFTTSGIFMTKWGSEGSGDGQFRNPEGVAVDSAGFVYVVDQQNHRIQKFRLATQTLLKAEISFGPLRVDSQKANFALRPGLFFRPGMDRGIDRSAERAGRRETRKGNQR